MEECALTLNVSILCRRVVLYGWCDGVWVGIDRKAQFSVARRRAALNGISAN